MTNETAQAQDSSIPQLSDHYHKGRKFYALSSGLLLAWTLVGIEVEKAPIESLKVSLKNPDVTPIILVLLVLYFAYRTVVEWYQSDDRRRRLPASRVDFAGANTLGVFSLAVYSFQEVSSANIGGYLASVISKAMPSIFLSIFAVLTSYYIARLLIWSILTPPKTQRYPYGWFYNRFPQLWNERASHPESILGITLPKIFIDYSKPSISDLFFSANFVLYVVLVPAFCVLFLYSAFAGTILPPLNPLLTSVCIVIGCLSAWVVRYRNYDFIINPMLRGHLGLDDNITKYEELI